MKERQSLIKNDGGWVAGGRVGVWVTMGWEGGSLVGALLGWEGGSLVGEK